MNLITVSAGWWDLIWKLNDACFYSLLYISRIYLKQMAMLCLFSSAKLVYANSSGRPR
jgi:hypothetical protein